MRPCAAARHFDRIIENIRKVAGRCRIAIGGNFDESSVDSIRVVSFHEQDSADMLVK